MSAESAFEAALLAYFALVPLSFVALLVLKAPYGRHRRRGWGPQLDTRLSWILWESPSVFAFALFFFLGSRAMQGLPLLFFVLWQAHYLQRTFIYPLRMRAGAGHRTPLLILGLGAGHNLLASYLNASWLSEHGPGYAGEWVTDPRFLAGLALFAAGYAINRHSDALLRRLRRPGEGGYGIPRGGLFRWVSCPNYLGEILLWSGWALATWSPAGLAFALYTAANLVPRALAHHLWYLREFPDYPRGRSAVIPFLL